MKTILLILVVFSFRSASGQHISSMTCPHTAFSNKNSIKWDGAEHIYLGDVAYRSLCTELGLNMTTCPAKFARYDKKANYSYGQMAALGDFYQSGDHMFEEKGYGNISDSAMSQIFQCMDKEGRVMHEQRTHPELNFPNCDWVFILNSKKYLILAQDNFDHFSWGAVKSYVRDHEQALQLARLAYEMRIQGKHKSADYYHRRAVFVNGVADHYLMDLFSAGHVDIPRYQVRQFAEQKLSGIFKKFRGDALAAILHENNSRDEQLREVGLHVMNALGEEWSTHSDGHMMACSSDNDPVIRLPVLAIKTSLKELYDVLLQGKEISTYGALDFVPRPKEPYLEAKYKSLLFGNSDQANQVLDKLRNTLPTALKVITTNADVASMIRNLPSIMTQYKKDISRDLQTNVLLQKRLSTQVKNFWLQ